MQGDGFATEGATVGAPVGATAGGGSGGRSARVAGSWLPWHVSPRQADWLVFGVALMLSAGVLAKAHPQPHHVATLVALPFGTIPLLWRRSHPGPVLAVLFASFTIPALFVHEPTGAGLVFGGYAAAVYGERRVRRVAGVLAVPVLIVAFSAVYTTGSARALGHVTGVAFGYGLAWVHGDRTRTRRAYLAELEDRARRLHRERDDHALRAAEQERTRIARELHDVVAHHVSVIAIQAGAARATGEAHPDRALQTLGLIERSARTTLGELRALLGVLRSGDAASPLRPQPSLARLDELLEETRAAGIDVEVRREGTVRSVPAMVDLCAYRVVQEAMTNIGKHAPQAHVHLLVRYTSRELRVTVVDDGPGASGGSGGGSGGGSSSGHGLIGMRERVSLVGGTLALGPALGGGFRVEARLPLAGVRS